MPDKKMPNEREIEVTPEMIEAGLLWLCAYEPGYGDARQTVTDIFKAMANAKARQPA